MITDYSQRPIFVVGSSRSGTGLMRTCLNSHPDIHLAGETHYFDDLRQRMQGRERSRLTPREMSRCEDYFLAVGLGSYHVRGDPGRDPVAREELRASARRLGCGADAYFEAFCRQQAEARGRARWGEKTPRHVFRIREMLERYPRAQVVCMVRDPRAVVASYRDRTNRPRLRPPDVTRGDALGREQSRQRDSTDPLLNSLLWRSSVRAGRQARRRFGRERVHVQHFEGLVGEPEHALRRLAEWLEVDFSPSMLDVTVRNSSYAGIRGSRGISTQPVERWRTTLSDAEVGVVQSACGTLMEHEGYARVPVPNARAIVVWRWLALPASVARASRANRSRAGSLPRYVWRRLRLAMGGARF